MESFSGIRGLYGQGFSENVVENYVQAFCELNKGKVFVVAGDSRESLPALKKAAIRSFQNRGAKEIIDLGIVPVQVAEYSTLKFKAAGGVYISASHNEPEYNGLKFLKQDGALLYPKDMAKLCKKARKVKLLRKSRKIKITNKHKESVEAYLKFVLKRIGKKAAGKIKKVDFKILADPNGGSAIVILDKLFKLLNVRAKIINNKLGSFKRLIEPNEKSLRYLQGRARDFDFACGFDCDADRMEIVTRHSTISGNYVLALGCDSFLSGTKNQTVITNDCTSYLVRDVIEKHQAKIKEAEVGEMNIVLKMEKQKSVIGGEGSCGGVIMFPIKCRDGIMSVVLILKMLAETRKSLVEVLKSYPKYYSERTKVFCSFPNAVKKKIEGYFKSQGFKIKKTGGLSGGLKILIDKNSYLWFRQSKTEANAFRIISDSNNKKKTSQILKKGIALFNKLNKNKI